MSLGHLLVLRLLKQYVRAVFDISVGGVRDSFIGHYALVELRAGTWSDGINACAVVIGMKLAIADASRACLRLCLRRWIVLL